MSLCSIHDYCLDLCKQATRASMNLCEYNPKLDLGLCMHAGNCYILMLPSTFTAYSLDSLLHENNKAKIRTHIIGVLSCTHTYTQMHAHAAKYLKKLQTVQ